MHDRFSPQPWISYYSRYDSLSPRPKDNDVLFLGSIICHTYISSSSSSLAESTAPSHTQTLLFNSEEQMITVNNQKAQIVTLWVGVNVYFQSPSITDFWRKEISLKKEQRGDWRLFLDTVKLLCFFFFLTKSWSQVSLAPGELLASCRLEWWETLLRHLYSSLCTLRTWK